MNGNNRTVIIDVDNITSSIEYAILAFTLDYHTQVLYWVFGDGDDNSLTVTSSNVDGTNRQTILRLTNGYNIYYYHLLDRYPPGLTVYKETLLLSMNVVYSIKLGRTSKNFTIFINSSMLCRNDYNQLKVTKQPPGELH